MGVQQIVILVMVLVAFGGMAIGLAMSIKKHEEKIKTAKRKNKKGRSKYMPQAKNPGR